jgi:hypothetical protein
MMLDVLIVNLSALVLIALIVWYFRLGSRR